MTPILEEWIKELEEGKYQQGRDVLHRDGCFCALGVLGDICVRHGLAEWEKSKHTTAMYLKHYHFDEPYAEACSIPGYLAEDIGIKDHMFQSKVVAMNDKEKLTFPQIAQRLKEMLGGQP